MFERWSVAHRKLRLGRIEEGFELLLAHPIALSAADFIRGQPTLGDVIVDGAFTAAESVGNFRHEKEEAHDAAPVSVQRAVACQSTNPNGDTNQVTKQNRSRGRSHVTKPRQVGICAAFTLTFGAVALVEFGHALHRANQAEHGNLHGMKDMEVKLIEVPRQIQAHLTRPLQAGQCVPPLAVGCWLRACAEIT